MIVQHVNAPRCHAEQVSEAFGAAGNTLGPLVLTMAAENN
jgi:hypothetical protein